MIKPTLFRSFFNGLLSEFHHLHQVVFEGLKLAEDLRIHEREWYKGLRLAKLTRLQRQHRAIVQHYIATCFLILLHTVNTKYIYYYTLFPSILNLQERRWIGGRALDLQSAGPGFETRHLEEQHKARVERHRQEIMKQINDKERARAELREKIRNEGVALRMEQEQQEKYERKVIKQKVAAMRQQKVAEKYVKEVEQTLGKHGY
ncbi:hypothetical protein RR46_06200 [Papilio xuthus]|uniref:Uncharacterized protein n=1 Tax=Papilio xuthus TaxID=66420 RepID=A0A194QC47_PAPXU|nr:hypothetical protein RR46_06200 [Papilio xuthus]